MWLGLNKTSLEIGLLLLLLILLYYCLSYSEKNITVPRPARSCRRFLQDSFILSFCLKKHDSQYASELPAFQRTALVFKYRKPPRYRGGLCTSSKYYFRTFEARERQIFSIFVPFCSKDQNKLCVHDKNSETCRTLGKK